MTVSRQWRVPKTARVSGHRLVFLLTGHSGLERDLKTVRDRNHLRYSSTTVGSWIEQPERPVRAKVALEGQGGWGGPEGVERGGGGVAWRRAW